MKHAPIYLIALVTLALAGCKGCEDTPVPLDVDAQRIVSLRTSVESNSRVTTYTYDAQGRIILEKWTPLEGPSLFPDTDTSYVTYRYETDRVVKTTTLQPGDRVQPETILPLNAQGYYSPQTAVYTYSPDGYRTSITAMDSTGQVLFSETYTYQDGNLIQRVYESGTLPAPLVYTYEYDLTRRSTVESQHFGQAFMGRGNQHVLMRSFVGGSPLHTYAYEYDAQGRVIRKVENPDTDFFVEMRYVYAEE